MGVRTLLHSYQRAFQQLIEGISDTLYSEDQKP
jgi:hypothetical protein